jgi:lambda repressor-like predicted transcriptional regulator
MRKAVTFARMGHNHWVLQDIMAELKKNATSLIQLKKHIEGVVSAYEGNTASETFASAVRFAYKLAAGEKI